MCIRDRRFIFQLPAMSGLRIITPSSILLGENS
jgi:hypothetical protein